MIALAAVVAALAPTAHTAAVETVAVRDDYFKAKSVTVRRGTNVRWVWEGKSPHNVRVARGPVKFGSPLKTTGTYSKRLNKKGTYRLVCTIHQPTMQMTVRVR